MPRKIIFLLSFSLFSFFLNAQPYDVKGDFNKRYKEAVTFFNQKDYGYAYPLFNSLRDDPNFNLIQDDFIRNHIVVCNIACELSLLHSIAETKAIDFIHENQPSSLTQLLSYYLGHYFYQLNDFEQAIKYYDDVNYQSINNEQIADLKFEKAYALFNLKKFEEARPLFDEITQLSSSKYYYAAQYYFGFLCYYFKDFENALRAFNVAVIDPEYNKLVPYYISEVLYYQGKKDAALNYGDSVLKQNANLYYQNELLLLIGQLYFEKNNYTKALPLLEDYVNKYPRVSKEILYELSYCYYQTNDTKKAIEGFKELSSERDSLGQNSMYQLASIYLSIEDKKNARVAFHFCANNSSDKVQQMISRFNYAKLSYELGYQDIALTETRTFLHDYPSSSYDAEIKELLVSLLAKTNDFASGVKLYESLDSPTINAQKVYPILLFGKAMQSYNDMLLDEAERMFNKITNTPFAEKIIPYAKFWMGEIEYRQKRYDAAIRNLLSFINANPVSQNESNIQNARYSLGYAYFQKQQFKEALAQFEAIVKPASSGFNSFEQDVFLRVADCYYALKGFSKAQKLYEQVMENDFSQADYGLFQKSMIVGIKNSNEKIVLLKTLSQKYPSSSLIVDAKMEMATTYIAEQNFTQAIPYLIELIRNKNTVRMKPLLYAKLGLSYFNIGDNDQALSAYTSLIQEFPQSSETEDALYTVKEIYVDMGRVDDYLELLQKSGIHPGKNEADSITYIAAFKKYEAGEYSVANSGFNNYLTKYFNGMYKLEANYYNGICCQKLNNQKQAIQCYKEIIEMGSNPYYENVILATARLYYFQIKNYDSSQKYFELLYQSASNNENKLEALRGLIRSCYELKNYSKASAVANDMLNISEISTDDKAIALLMLGKSMQISNDCPSAIITLKSLASINKSAWGAEARYEIAQCYFNLGNTELSEKAALSVIKETGSYDLWVTKSYILLGDIFVKQKDYFNAKATYESVYKNAVIPELKTEAQKKLKEVQLAERKSSRLE